jgi:MurNAc alpha-1-phosphate uridylyltransferase
MSVNITDAMILAAGLGKRMRPLTLNRPKPLVHLSGTPLIDYTIKWLAAAGIVRAVVNTSYKAQMLEAYLEGCSQLEMRISPEGGSPLETGGGVLKALPLLGDAPFVALNSDAIFPHITSPHPLQLLANAWDDAKMDFLMLLIPKSHAFGLHGKADFIRLDSGEVCIPANAEDAEYVFTGVEIIHPRVFENCPDGAFSLRALWDRSRDENGVYKRVHSIVLDANWLHVGDLQGLEIATNYMANAANKAAATA